MIIMNDELSEQIYPQVNLTSLVAKGYVETIMLSGKSGNYITSVEIIGNDDQLIGKGNNILKAVTDLNKHIILKHFELH